MSVNDVRNSIQQVKTENERVQSILEEARQTLDRSRATLSQALNGSDAPEAQQIMHGLNEAEDFIGRGRDFVEKSMQEAADYERRL